MNITCTGCGKPKDHASPGCADHRADEAREAHLCAQANGLPCPKGCPICAILTERYGRGWRKSRDAARVRLSRGGAR